MLTRVGLIGLGYWGPNLVRCFNELEDCKVTAVCDKDPQRLTTITDRFPGTMPTDDADELFKSGKVDAVVVATPTTTHYDLASRAIAHGLHVFVEKPLATSSDECQRLIEQADAANRTLFVGHVFLHSAPVKKLKELINNGELGEVRYISSDRLNLGPVRHDVNALWDLAPHDISIILHLLGASPNSVSCSGSAYLTPGVHDVCNLTLHFDNKQMGIVNVSWLDPRKKRTLTVVGSQKMATYDDLEIEKIKIFDKGVDAPDYSTNFGEFQFSYRYGDTFSPRLKEVEPLKAECADFISSIRDCRQPLTDGVNGLQVVEVLEAAQQSLFENGQRITLNSPYCLKESATHA
ncbi:MAG: Gfo/Idh/MocA family oxidoreductase [Planctomycetales bacterium]|nr:Gfo/Idh/MocA family oxidoreductase [Planctomycetales bacterium]